MSIGAGIAQALGYLHSKGYFHGRLCSRNVFLEPKVQVSMLDYAASRSNVIYSSPELISVRHGDSCGTDRDPPVTPYYRGQSPSDDVFALGTLLFELFSGKLPSCSSR